MFSIKDLVPIESWRLRDDLDLEDFRGSWLSYPSNTKSFKDAELALIRYIQAKAELRAMFLTNSNDRSKTLCPKAIAIYKAYTQEFFRQALVLCYIPLG
jgi:hypothetical protein